MSDMSAYLADFRAMADRAAPFMDAGWLGSGWRPSELLRIGFYALITGPRPEASAEFANQMFAEARDLYRRGLVANPFAATAQRGEGAGDV